MQARKRTDGYPNAAARRRMKKWISFMTGLLIGLVLIALCLGALLLYMNYTGYGVVR